MPLKTARKFGAHFRPVRVGCCVSIAALLILFSSNSLQTASADGDTRSLSFRHTHTNEKLTITYKVNGRYDDEALKKLNHVLRDWREDQTISMDPHLLDLIWDVYREVEATEPIAIVCGYRSPGTNAMLRRRSSGVAKFSQHMLGKALDFYIPGVPLEKLREAGLRASRGGVGFYPSSNFVHLDTGSVRHWPRMPEEQLAKVMAKGPLTAVASRKTDTKVASARIPNPFAALFGVSGEQEEDAETLAATAPAATRTAEAKKPAPKANEKASEKANGKSAERPAAVAAAPTPAARPSQSSQPQAFDLASASSRPVDLRQAGASSLVNGGNRSANDVISERGLWQTTPDNSAQMTAAAKAAAARVATADPANTSSTNTAGGTPWPMPSREPTGSALAYAPTSHPAAPSRPATASAATASAPAARTASATPAPQRDTTVAAKRATEQPATAAAPASAQSLAAALAQAKAGQQFNDPWMRAMIVAPSAGGFMNTSLLGSTDFRTLSPYLHKPSTSIMMTFGGDPHLGMRTDRFAGTAVVFISTVTFSRRTASLQ